MPTTKITSVPTELVTTINADTEICIPECHIVFTGNTKKSTARGARWHLVTDEGETPIRAFVIG